MRGGIYSINNLLKRDGGILMLHLKNKLRRELILLGIVLTIVVFPISICFAGTDYIEQDFSPNGSAWTEDLMPEEQVISVYTERLPNSNDFTTGSSDAYGNSDGMAPKEANLRWFAMKKTYIGLSYSGWKFAGASTISGGVLHASHTKSISNTFSGNLMVTVKALQGLIGFDTTATSTSTVGYSTPNLPKLAGKGHRLEYRHVYKKYKVTQEKKYDRRATKSYGTAYVYPQEWAERQYRVVVFKR